MQLSTVQEAGLDETAGYHILRDDPTGQDSLEQLINSVHWWVQLDVIIKTHSV